MDAHLAGLVCKGVRRFDWASLACVSRVFTAAVSAERDVEDTTAGDDEEDFDDDPGFRPYGLWATPDAEDKARVNTLLTRMERACLDVRMNTSHICRLHKLVKQETRRHCSRLFTKLVQKRPWPEVERRMLDTYFVAIHCSYADANLALDSTTLRLLGPHIFRQGARVIMKNCGGRLVAFRIDDYFSNVQDHTLTWRLRAPDETSPLIQAWSRKLGRPLGDEAVGDDAFQKFMLTLMKTFLSLEELRGGTSGEEGARSVRMTEEGAIRRARRDERRRARREMRRTMSQALASRSETDDEERAQTARRSEERARRRATRHARRETRARQRMALLQREEDLEAAEGHAVEAEQAEAGRGDLGDPGPEPEVDTPGQLNPDHHRESAGGVNEETQNATQASLVEAPSQGNGVPVQAGPAASNASQSTDSAFNADVVVLLRVARMTRTLEVREALCASPTLACARLSVANAGCSMEPEWAGGAMLLVPLTPDRLVDASVELAHHHIIVFPCDVEHVRDALKNIRLKKRPRLHAVEPDAWLERLAADGGQPSPEGQSGAEDEAGLPEGIRDGVDAVVEGKLRLRAAVPGQSL